VPVIEFSGMKLRTVGMVAGVLVAIEVALCAGLYWAMRQPPDVFGSVMMKVPMPMMLVLPFGTLWKSARGGSVSAGDAAPDFRLPTLDHKSTVQLASFRGVRPVVLVFGSYT
jgi:hypothetical protein